MKIVKQTPELMVLLESPLAGIFIGVFFALLGVLMLVKPASFAEDVPLWLGVVFVIAGVALTLFLSKVTSTFDKASAKVLITSQSLLKKVSQELTFAEIEAVELREMRDRKGVSYGIFLLMVGGGVTPLQNSFDYGSGFARKRLIQIKTKQVAQSLADFLSVPLKEIGLADIYETIKNVYQSQGDKSGEDRPE